jgi:hypothetical protein
MNELQVKTNNEFEMNVIQKININKYNFYSIYEYCDSIRVNDNRFFFASATNDNLNLVILLFDIFNNDQNILMRYYKISLKLYNFRFFTSTRGIIYNNYIALTFSAFDDSINNLKSSCYLTIFGYISSNDLIENNDIFDEKDEYAFNIKNYISITINIFGYELLNIKISNISQFQNKGLIILDSNNNTIKENDRISFEDKLTIKKISGVPFGTYVINYIGYITEAKNYYDLIKYVDDYIYFGPNNNENPFELFYQPSSMPGKEGCFNFTVNKCYKTCSNCNNIMGNYKNNFCSECSQEYKF